MPLKSNCGEKNLQKKIQNNKYKSIKKMHINNRQEQHLLLLMLQQHRHMTVDCIQTVWQFQTISHTTQLNLVSIFPLSTLNLTEFNEKKNTTNEQNKPLANFSTRYRVNSKKQKKKKTRKKTKRKRREHNFWYTFISYRVSLKYTTATAKTCNIQRYFFRVFFLFF